MLKTPGPFQPSGFRSPVSVFSFFCFIFWDLAFGIWPFAKVAAQPQTTKPDPFRSDLSDRTPAAEVVYLAAYFRHLSRRRNPAYLAGLDAAWDAAKAGDRVSLDDFRRLEADAREAGL